MGDLGYQGAYGLQGLQAAIRQRVQDQQKQKQQDLENVIAERVQALREQDLAQRAQEHQQAMEVQKMGFERLKHQDEMARADREQRTTEALNEATPPGFLPENSPIAGRLQMIGAAVPQDARPAVDVGPLLPGDTGDAKLKGFVKLPSAKQLDVTADNERQAEAIRSAHEDRLAAAQDRTTAAERAQADRQENLRLAASLRAPTDKLVKVEHKDEATGRTVIEWLPQSELKNRTFQKGTSATTETRLASAEAVNQTGTDIIAKLSDPAYTKALGVAMGRYSKLQDFIGNPPPEFSELAGAIESYALANMGVHGMRSAQGAQQIKKLLDQPHTPESLIATIKGLNKFSEHFMQNEGRGNDVAGAKAPAASTTKPTAADLIKKYGGG